MKLQEPFFSIEIDGQWQRDSSSTISDALYLGPDSYRLSVQSFTITSELAISDLTNKIRSIFNGFHTQLLHAESDYKHGEIVFLEAHSANLCAGFFPVERGGGFEVYFSAATINTQIVGSLTGADAKRCLHFVTQLLNTIVI